MKFYKIVLSDGAYVQKAGNTRFAPLDEAYAETVAKTVEAEAAEWRLCINNEWMRADDLHDTKAESSSHAYKSFDVGAVKGILVNNGHFGGVVLYLEFSSGGGMSSHTDKNYCILHADGRISGENKSGYIFTGEDSDSENIDYYTLENIYGNAPIEEAKRQEGVFVYEISVEKENACALVGIEGEELGDLKIPETLGGYAVYAIAPKVCKGRADITSLEIPDSVEEIGEEAFAGCSRMRQLKIGKGLRAVKANGYFSGEGTFYACSGLETIAVHPENQHFRSDGNCLILIKTDNWWGTALVRDVLILGCNNTDLSKVKGIYEIEHYAFYGCEGLERIVVPNTVSRIGRGAFEQCTGLKEAILFKGSGMKTQISDSAFQDCSSLSYLFIEKGLRWVEESSFDGCSALKEICYGGTEANWRKASTGFNYRPFFDIPVLYEQTPKS